MGLKPTLLGLMVCAAPVAAWEFSPLPVCTIANEAEPQVEVTYDGQLYAIHITRAGGWPEAAVFSLRFEGLANLTISTDRHQVDGDTLSVSDRGFGNVLNGMQFNARATALLGALEVPFDLTGAAPAVEAFRDCDGVPAV